jgi:hypothetical protein
MEARWWASGRKKVSTNLHLLLVAAKGGYPARREKRTIPSAHIAAELSPFDSKLRTAFVQSAMASPRSAGVHDAGSNWLQEAGSSWRRWFLGESGACLSIGARLTPGGCSSIFPFLVMSR